MKNVLLIILIFINYTSFSQGKVDEYKKMIDSAIIIQQSPSSSPGGRVIHLIDQNDNPYILVSDKDQQKFKSIAVYSKGNRKLIKKGIRAWKVLPVLSKNKLIVTIIDFYITYKNKNYNFANGGGATVVFEYSCDRDEWMFAGSAGNIHRANPNGTVNNNVGSTKGQGSATFNIGRNALEIWGKSGKPK